MKIHRLVQEQVLPVTMEEAWNFFSDPRNLDQITPDELGFRIESGADDSVHEGQVITYRVRIAPLIRVRWVTEIKAVDPGRSFVDEQRFGPYKFWHHRHVFEECEGGARMTDTVCYAVGFGVIGGIIHMAFVGRKLRRIFEYRRSVLAKHFGSGEAEA